MEALRGWTSGLAIPAFVIDAPGGGGKIPLLPEYVVSMNEDEVVLRNFRGERYVYRQPQEEVGAGVRPAIPSTCRRSSSRSGSEPAPRSPSARAPERRRSRSPVSPFPPGRCRAVGVWGVGYRTESRGSRASGAIVHRGSVESQENGSITTCWSRRCTAAVLVSA
jgi:Lysine 2,3-aminomutase